MPVMRGKIDMPGTIKNKLARKQVLTCEYDELSENNLEDVAEHLSISQDTVRTWIKEGKLPVYRAGKRYKFKISEVDEWVRKGKIQE